MIDIGPAGQQPLRDDESGTVIVFNGEICNYVELRRELESRGHRLRSQSDTEALLRAYLEGGSRCVQRLNGMWAFAIWDPRRVVVVISRDRFGVKPLFMARRQGRLMIASEPKVLLALEPDLRRPNHCSLYRLLAQKRVYTDDESFYEAIDVFPAAHIASYRPESRSLNLTRYWNVPPQDSDSQLSRDEANDAFAALFEDAVRPRLRSDVPLGVTLSGGLDSTAVVHSARKSLPTDDHLVAHTSVYDADGCSGVGDESAWAEIATAAESNIELRRVSGGSGRLDEHPRRIVWHMDGPGFWPAVFPLWNIAERARSDGIKVLLEGQGADEWLGGSSWHTAASLVDSVRATWRERSVSQLRQAARGLRGAYSQFAWQRLLRDVRTLLAPRLRAWDLRRSALTGALSQDLLRCGEEEGGTRAGREADFPDLLSRRLLGDFTRDLLPGFLPYGDSVMMAHSIENRLPFMDYRLVELGFRMPGHYKVHAGDSKSPLRTYLRAAGQHRIADRQRKMGYPTPANEWMAADGGALLKDLLLDRDAGVHEFVDPAALSRVIDHHATGAFAAGDSPFSLVCTELGLQQCIRNSSAPKTAGIEASSHSKVIEI